MHLKLTNGQPEKYSIGQLRRDNPNTSFPKNPTDQLLADWSVYPYTRPNLPEYDPLTANVVDGSFEQDTGGNWVLPYVVENKPHDVAERNIRSRRDTLLSETDWVVVMHTEKGTNIPLEWELYRQQLRDITGQEGFPYSVVWPTKP
jgi:hypothetical protein